MTKLEEIIAKYNYDNDSFLSIESMMRDYAEWYAKKCLEIASEDAKLQLKPNKDKDGFITGMKQSLNKDSILNIKLPDHDN